VIARCWSPGLATIPRGRPPGSSARVHPIAPTRSGLHRVEVLAIDGLRVLIQPLEALDQTPIIDVEPVLDAARER
jgi:tRNA (Thr-GGU) A37 N-methylase